MREHTLSRLVVGVDGSAQSESALRWALDHADELSTIVAVLVREGEPRLLPGTSYAVQPHGRVPVASEAEYRARLQASIDAVTGHDDRAPVTPVLATGDPGAELVRKAADADVLVVGSHGARPLTQLWLGSVAGYCVRHAPCAVVVIPATLTVQPAVESAVRAAAEE